MVRLHFVVLKSQYYPKLASITGSKQASSRPLVYAFRDSKPDEKADILLSGIFHVV